MSWWVIIGLAVLVWWVWHVQTVPTQPAATKQKMKGIDMSIELGVGESKQVTAVPVDAAGRDTVLPATASQRSWLLKGDGPVLMLTLDAGQSVRITGAGPGSSVLRVEQTVDGVLVSHEEDVVVKANPVVGFRFDVQPVLSPAELLKRGLSNLGAQ